MNVVETYTAHKIGHVYTISSFKRKVEYLSQQLLNIRKTKLRPTSMLIINVINNRHPEEADLQPLQARFHLFKNTMMRHKPNNQQPITDTVRKQNFLLSNHANLNSGGAIELPSKFPGKVEERLLEVVVLVNSKRHHPLPPLPPCPHRRNPHLNSFPNQNHFDNLNLKRLSCLTIPQ
ncbi:hypothetical protein HanPSC8_Chr09g0398461 [Helianthus annuus]|nr:hypothetical protein HanPSC8_Chr09g0398461 [Helianthus annuus]